MDAVTALKAHMEAITRKLDTLTHSMNMIQTPASVYVVCGTVQITISRPLASTHMVQPKNVNYAQNFQRQQTILTITIQTGKSSQTPHGLIIKDKIIRIDN